MRNELGVGRLMCIRQLGSAGTTIAPVTFLAQSRHGPGLYAIFPAHLLNNTGYRSGMWAYSHNVLPPSDDPPTSGPVMQWNPGAPAEITVEQNLVIQDYALDWAIPLEVGSVVLGPVLYRSNYAGLASASYNRAWAMPGLDLAVAFVNAFIPLQAGMFQLPGQNHGFVPPATPFPLQNGSTVRVCTEFVDGDKNSTATVSYLDENGCVFDIRPQSGIPEPGYSGAPVIYQPDGAAPMLVGYVIQGEGLPPYTTTVVRADAALEHLGIFCATLGLSIADASPASRAVWNAGFLGRSSFYQLFGDWP